eukprot:TRINITY_DN16218_c0_g1_i4.p1 TRINITY_DN16218_c0_g1~~TRINITY_DN16218_c0_g1_i4.p1  ORF type:complete len:687 (+),score=99.56 TRINITY_DN16218_c0_g1_i4:158-2218(+)
MVAISSLTMCLSQHEAVTETALALPESAAAATAERFKIPVKSVPCRVLLRDRRGMVERPDSTGTDAERKSSAGLRVLSREKRKVLLEEVRTSCVRRNARASLISLDTSATMDSDRTMDSAFSHGQGSNPWVKGQITTTYSRKVPYSSKAQQMVHEFMQTLYYELGLCAIVVLNLGCMILDVNHTRSCLPGEKCEEVYWLEVTNKVLLSIYTVDIVLALFALRWYFFKSVMTCLDLSSVLVGYIEISAESVAVASSTGLGLVRLLRIARLLRVVKILRTVPELHELVIGFFATLRAIFWGFVMMVLLCILWSVIILQAFDMLGNETLFRNDPRFAQYWCEDAFQSTGNTILLLWQTLIAGDSWGACMLPVIMHSPAMSIVFATAFVCVSIGFQNLILAVVVERASHRSEEDQIVALMQERLAHETEIQKYHMMFESMDKDGTGKVSLTELVAGVNELEEFQNSLLLQFGLDITDMTDLVKCFDRSNSGEVIYQDVTEAMFKSQRQKDTTQLMIIHSQLSKLMAMVAHLDRKVDRMNGPRPTRREQKPATAHNDLQAVCSAASGGRGEVEKIEENVMGFELESLELRLQNMCTTMHQQSVCLAEETQALAATLIRLAAVVPHPPSNRSQSTTLLEEPSRLTHEGPSSEQFPTLTPQPHQSTSQTATMSEELTGATDMPPATAKSVFSI